MLTSIAAFEIKKRLKLISTAIYAGIFFALAFLLMCAAADAFESAHVSFGGAGKVLANSPESIINFVGLISYVATPVIAALMGNAIYLDYESNIHTVLYSYPITKRSYLLGRFVGAWLVCLLVLSGIGIALLVASWMPFLEPARMGPTNLYSYLHPYFLIVIPNLVFLGGIFFSMAVLGRKMAPVYVAGVLLLIGYLIAGRLIGDMENKTISSLVDPFGLQALDNATRYWTVQERNSRHVPFEGALLANRILWVSVGLAALAFAYRRFRWDVSPLTAGGRAAPVATEELMPTLAAPVVNPVINLWQVLRTLTVLQFNECVRSVYFLVIVLAGVLFLISTASQISRMFGTAIYPVTGLVLEVASGSFGLFVVIIITFFAGELVWRERDAQVNQITDALPVPTWVFLTSKLLTLMGVAVILQGVVMVCGLITQVVHGYTRFEFPLYLETLFGLRLWQSVLTCALALFVHVLINHKYMAHLLMVLYYLSAVVFDVLGWEHNLLRYGDRPRITYSDMNGFSHVIWSVFAFGLYWSLWGVLLTLMGVALWPRGGLADLTTRRRNFSSAMRGGIRKVSAATLAGILLMGGWILYNTNVLNKYVTSKDSERHSLQYEQKYKQYEAVLQPKITDVSINVDLTPSQRGAHIKGHWTLRNVHSAPVTTLFLNLWDGWTDYKFTWSRPTTPDIQDEALRFFSYKLATPLAPEEDITLDFELNYTPRGFANEPDTLHIVENGTFFSSELLPTLGYERDVELSDDNVRRKFGLAERARMADLDDVAARENNYVGDDADWLGFETTLSTDPDQIALAPGYQVREWQENGRRYFHYKMDAPILGFYSFLSARYAVKKDRWKDVALEIYYHPAHTYNLDAMMDGMKDALEYCSAHFSPYQHRQARILEFPRYQMFAQSFPNTIPYSEGIGFIAKVDPDDKDDVDYPYYVTAHEIAHQWWAHQVIGANVQGATLMSESLAEYSALMVMKKRFGAPKMRRFLKYDLDRYLEGRGLERKKELPLMRGENQPYIHYSKGSLVMYQLQDVLGEDVVNQALASFLKKNAFHKPPYPTSRDFMVEIRAVTPADKQDMITDLFETITIYENIAESAKATKTADGTTVTLHVKTRKLRVDGVGEETNIPVAEEMEIGVFDKDGKELHLARHAIQGPEMDVVVQVQGEPTEAGIDPYNKLIDRQSDDNRTKVTAE